MCLALGMAYWPPNLQARSETLFADSRLCDFHNFICANIRIAYEYNEKIMHIRGRIHKPHGKGLLTFYMEGITPINERISLPITIEVRGQYNEIISKKLQTPLSNRTEWSLKEMVFDPEPD